MITLREKMGLLAFYYSDRVKTVFRDLKLSNPKAWNPALWNLYGSSNTEASIHINEDTGLNLSSVYNAIQIISGATSILPIHLYKRNKDNSRKKIIGHPAQQILNAKTNEVTIAMSFRECSMGHLLGWGNSYAEIVRNQMGTLSELWIITPDRVTPMWENKTIIYEIAFGSEKVYLPRERILHISGLGYNGIIGYSVIRKAAESIGLGMAAEQFGARFFGQNTNMGGILKFPRALGEDAKENLKKSLNANYTGLGKSHRWMILEQGVEIEKLGISPDDSQFLQTRQFQVQDIARWFNIPPHFLKDLSRATYSNIEEQGLEFVKYTLSPWLTRLEQWYNAQLLTDNERRLGYYFKHSIEGLLRGDSESRAKFYQSLFNMGSLTPNEIRELEDMDRLDAENADKSYIQLNLVPLDDIDKEPEPIPAEPEPDQVPVKPDEENDKRSFWRKILDRDATQVKMIEYRSVIGRDKISARYYSLILDAAERIILKEAKAIKKQVKNRAGEFDKWFDEFYKHMPAYIRKQMQGTMASFQESIMEQAASEVNIDLVDIEKEIKSWIDGYMDVYIKRHIGRSIGQVSALKIDDINDRMDNWLEKRPEKIAVEESVRASNAATQFIFWSTGFVSVWRIRGAQTCPYCQELNGRAVKSGEMIFGGGENFEPSGAKNGPMKINRGISHPPLHQGCDCYVSHR